MAARAPGVHTHEEWKGMAQPVGLVVEPVVLNRLGVFPESTTTVLADWQQRLEQLLEDKRVGEQWLTAAPSFELFCEEVLAWQAGDLRKPDELTDSVAVSLEDYDEVLRPDWVVPEPSQEEQPLKAQLLVQELPLGTAFDALPKGLDGRRQWEATPQQRLERLLKESEHPIGLLWNGVALRLVFAPRGESSGHLTFPLEPMTTVDGRPMLAALQMLLGPDRLFEGGASNTRLRPLMEQSRKEQNEVSTRLAEQVLEALWILLRGFDAAGLAEAEEDPSHIYGGLITVLLRLVFLLYAEDEELMPGDSLYGQHYSVGGLALRLRQDRADYQNAMEGRRGAWATLLSLFRLVYDGGGPSEAYLPARHGDLFDPDAYPFLEGRTAESTYSDGPLASVPAISDDVVEQVLTKLLLLDGQILSYRALDVEQIGSVYEGIMGFTVEQAQGPSVGITYRPPRQKITITVVVDAEQLLAQAASKREKWLDEQAGVKLKLPAAVKRELKTAENLNELCVALDKKLSAHTPRGLQAGSLILQPTAERRRSGSHYTPRALTEPIVAEAFRPWLERCNHQPTAEQILALKVCDPAMGSGAFLVAVCRFLAGWLVQAWERDGYPDDFRQEWDKDTVARRLVAQRCLYGVDKNPFAVNLAKLSLWLVTLSENQPFTFVDHALKCGDSLVGYSVKEIQAAISEVQLGFVNDQNQMFAQMGIARRESFGDDNFSDEGYDRKKLLLQQQIKATEGLRQTGDLMVASFFDAPKAKDRADKQQVYLSMLSGAFNDEGLQDSIQDIRKRLATGDKGITPFHWDLEFPEVFGDQRGGFDLFVGNPPFVKGSAISTHAGDAYFEWLKEVTPEGGGQTDLCGYFVNKKFGKTSPNGSVCFITTNTISQGDTRRASLLSCINNGGHIFYAVKRVPWLGAAAVIASIVGLTKEREVDCHLNGRQVDDINSFLIEGEKKLDPKTLSRNAGLYASGFYNYGEGFIFADSNEKCESISSMKAIISTNPKCSEVLHPFIGGEEILSSPIIKPQRWIIDFEDMSLEEVSAKYPQLLQIIRNRVKPERDKIKAKSTRENWWKFHRPGTSIRSIMKGQKKMLAHPFTCSHLSFVFLNADTYLAAPHFIFASEEWHSFAILQSRIHDEWVRLTSSTLKDDTRYAASDCFDTFPFPPNTLVKTDHEIIDSNSSCLGLAGKDYYNHRENIMEKDSIGLTNLYNAFNDPGIQANTSLLHLRSLHQSLDQAVLNAYKWTDISTACGFGLDHLDIEDDAQLPDDLQERIDSGELFFWDAKEAINFESQLRASGGVKGKKKLPWRYRWPDAVRDDVLARLLALNAERYEEEVALGLHSKGAKKPTGAKRGRKPKKAATPEAQSFQLEPEPQQMAFDLSGGK